MTCLLWPKICWPKIPRGGGYFQKNWVGVCCTLQETLNLFQTKICDFPYPVSDLIKNMKPLFQTWSPGAQCMTGAHDKLLRHVRTTTPPPSPGDILNTCLLWIFLFSNAVFSLELNNLTLPSPQDVSTFNKKNDIFRIVMETVHVYCMGKFLLTNWDVHLPCLFSFLRQIFLECQNHDNTCICCHLTKWLGKLYKPVKN